MNLQKIQIKTLKGDLFQIEVDGEDQVYFDYDDSTKANL